jgi:hypothetical protein
LNSKQPYFNYANILLAGFLVGTLDISAACLDYYIGTGKGPEGVLRYVARGVFGAEAGTGGPQMMFWGLLFHYIIAFSFTLFFFWLYPRLAFMRRQPIVFAFMYSLFMWAITTQVIIPLSRLPYRTIDPLKALKAVFILFFMIALPLTLFARTYYGKRKTVRASLVH